MDGGGTSQGKSSRVRIPPSLLFLRLLAGGKRGKTRLEMAEKFGGWFKGNRLSCLQPVEAASSPRWHGTCCSR